MQRILLVCCFCLFVISTLWGQAYTPFPTDSATWTVVEQGFGFPLPSPGVSHFGADGDTLIGGLLYTRLYANEGGLNVPNPYPAFDRAAATYYGAYRADSSHRVWFRGWAQSSDELRYDFSLAVGDTFCFANQQSGVLCHLVVAIDSILIGPGYRRRLHFAYNGQSESWIEGIGATVSGWNGHWSFVGNIAWSLNCFQTPPGITYGACDFPVGILPGLGSEVEIGPQPAGDWLQVRADAGLPLEMALMALDGRVLLRQAWTGSATLSLQGLAPGLYAYRLASPGFVPAGGKVLKF